LLVGVFSHNGVFDHLIDDRETKKISQQSRRETLQHELQRNSSIMFEQANKKSTWNKSTKPTIVTGSTG
jgi:hypothetical protein